VPILENDSYFSQYYSKLGSKGLKSRAKPTPSYGKEEEFLKTVLTPDEYEGLRQDVIKDTLLAGKMTRGEA